MALSTPALLVATGSTPHNLSTATSAAFTPTANALMIVAITGTQNVTFTSRRMSVKSSAGYNLSEILFLHRRLAASGIYIAIYVAKVGSSPPSQTITATWDANVQSIGISVCEITGHDLVQPVLSSFQDDGLAHGAVAYAGTWPTTPNTNNTIILIGAVDNNTPDATDITTGTGWTAITSAAFASDFVWTHWQYRTGSTSTSLAFNNLNDDGFSWVVAGIEVQVDQGARAPASASSMPGIGRRLNSAWGRAEAKAAPLGADIFAPFGSSQRKTVWENWFLASGGISGAAAITEAADTLSATGAVAIDGDASITEGSDTSASTAALSIAAAAAISEADDASSATGALAIAGALAATEADDTLSAAGAAGAGAISGVLAVTEADDALSAAGALAIAAALAATEADDTLLASAALAIAAAAISEAADTLATTATSTISGALAATEADDVLTATGEGPGGSTPTDGFWQIRQIRRA